MTLSKEMSVDMHHPFASSSRFVYKSTASIPALRMKHKTSSVVVFIGFLLPKDQKIR